MATTQEDLLIKVSVDGKSSEIQSQKILKQFAAIEKQFQKINRELAKQGLGVKQTKELALRSKDLEVTVSSLDSANSSLHQTQLAVVESNKKIVEAIKLQDANYRKTNDTLTVTKAVAVTAAGALAGIFSARLLKSVPIVGDSIKPINDRLDSMAGTALAAGNSLRKNLGVSALTAVEALALLSPVLYAVGGSLENMDNVLVATVGTIIKFVGLISGKFVAAISFGLSAIGAFIQRVGQNLVDSTKEAENAFQKFEVVINRFNFVVSSFAKNFGENAVGSLKEWGSIVEEVSDNTVFSFGKIAGSVKLLVAEGSALGISFTNNQKILRRSADIASGLGLEIGDVVGRIISAFNGQSSALANLGINLGKSGVEHSKYFKTLDKGYDQLTDQEKLQIRINELYKQSTSFIGAAANELNTIDGLQRAINKTYNETLVVLGKQNTATRTYLAIQLKLARVLSDLPEFLIVIIGTLKDIAGVTLVVVGGIIKYTFAILGLLGAFKLINLGLTKFLGVSISIGGILSFILKRVLPVVAIAIALKEGFSALINESEAFRRVYERILSVFKGSDSIEDTSDSINILAVAFDKLKSILIGLAKFIIGGLASSFVLLEKAVIGVKAMFASNAKEVKKYRKIQAQLNKDLKGLTHTQAMLIAQALPFKVEMGLAAKAMDAASLSAQGLGKNLNQALNGAIFHNFRKKVNLSYSELENLNKSILGSQYEVAVNKRATAVKKLNDLIKSGAKDDALNKAAVESEKARLEIIKLEASAIADLDMVSKNMSIARLQNSDREIASIKMERDSRLKALDDLKRGLELVGGATRAQLDKINGAVSNIQATASKAITDTLTTSLLESEDRLRTVRLENAEIFTSSNRSLENTLGLIQKQLKADIQRLDAKKTLLAIEGKLSKELEQQIDTQKKLLTENAKKAQRSEKGGQIGIDTEQIAGAFGEGAANMAGELGAAIGPAFMGPIAAAQGLVDVAQGIVDAIPNLLNSFADLINSITDFPQVLQDAIKNVLNAIVRYISEYIPNLIKAIPAILNDLIDALYSEIPDAIVKLVEDLPNMLIEGLINKLPDLIRKMTAGFLRVAIQLPIELLKAIPKITPMVIKGLIEAIPDIIDGVILGIKEGLNGIAEALGLGEIFNVGDLGKQITEPLENLASGVGDQLFSVLDVQGEARAISIRDQIVKGTKQTIGFLKKIIDGLVNAWRAIFGFFKGIVEGLIKGLRVVWDFINDKVVQPLLKGLQSIWSFVENKIIRPLFSVVEKIMGGIKGLFSSIANIFKGIFGGKFSALKDAITGAFSAGARKVGNLIAGVINPVINLLNALRLPQVDVGGKVLGKSFGFTLIPGIDLIPGDIGKISKFQFGGLVEGRQSGFNDTVPSLLTPGEFVLNRGAVNNLGLDNVRAMNAGAKSSGGDVIIQRLEINSNQPMDRNFVRDTIMPQIKKEFKRASFDGELLMSKRGVR